MMTHNTHQIPTISIILPTYNRAYCLDRAIQSVLKQSFTDWELIVVDNYSTDTTDQLLSNNYNDSRIKVIKIHNDGIIAASRNKGLEISSGIYVAFLDSDDWWVPNKLEKSIEALDDGADIVYHDLYLFQENLKIIYGRRAKTRNLKKPVFIDLFQNGNGINTSSVVVRKELIQKIDGFSEERDLIAAEDYDAWLRLSKLTDNFTRVKGCYGFYTVGNDNLSSSKKTIVFIKRIILLYQIDSIVLGIESPVWVNLSLAKSYLKIGRLLESHKFIKQSFKTVKKPKDYIKSILIYTQVILRVLIKKINKKTTKI